MLVTTFSGSIFTSQDGGATWTDDTEGIKSFPNAKYIEKFYITQPMELFI